MKATAGGGEVEFNALDHAAHEEDQITFGGRPIAIDFDPVVAGHVLLFTALLTSNFEFLARGLDKIRRLTLPPRRREFCIGMVALSKFLPQPRVPGNDRFGDKIYYLTPVDAS